ncbi:hypothetical protein [Halobellus sp. Atlit-38R]|jgi:hypothetical protein|nr:hypothetical protein [Halobellus sp. Atlit-38R]
MTEYVEMMVRADRAMHDVAQFHLHEFAADVTGVTDGRGREGPQ